MVMKMKKQVTAWEKIYIQQRTCTYTDLLLINYMKTNNSFKMDRRFGQTLHKIRYIDKKNENTLYIIIMEMKIETTMRNNHTPAIMAKIYKTDCNKY